MFRWIPYAMVRVTIFFVAGIACAITWPYQLSIWWSISLVAVYLIKRSGFIGLIAIFLFGFTRVGFHTEKNDPDHFINGKVEYYQVRISRYAEERERSWRTEGVVEAIYSDHHWESSTGNVQLYFPKQGKPFHYGDVLIVRAAPSLVKPPSNPGEFDLRRNLYFKNIYHQHFIRDGDAKLIRRNEGNPFIATAIDVRLWSDRQLKTYVKGEREQATASALVLGVTDGLDNDLLVAYASTGAMHVLAVSGLHVSIIYWIILLIGKPIEKLKSGKAMLAIISVVLLWIYAFVTGWSPSVLRAVMMFTFVALARPWKQSTNIYNTMAASAFCLLVYDPFFLMSVGFQLSYIAVFGIVFIHPHLYVLWEPNSKIMDETWKVTSVSIAAQIATVPISLYYFHQFPNYFLFANLLVIPASFVVLVVGLAVLPFSFIPFLASITGFVLQWTIYIMNNIVIFIGTLPFAVVKNIYIDGLQGLLLAAITLMILFCFIFKNIRCLWIGVIFTIAFSIIDWIHVRRVVSKSHITVYNIKGKTSIDLISNGRLSAYGEFDAFRMASNRVKLGANSTKLAVSKTKFDNELIVWKGRRIVIAKSALPENLEADILILSNNAFKTLPPTKCKIVIIDSSNSFYLAERLLRAPAPPGAKVYSVAHSGAYQYSF